MRAKGKKRSRFEIGKGSQQDYLPKGLSWRDILSGDIGFDIDEEIADELAAKDAAIAAEVNALRKLRAMPWDKRKDLPYIAGYTDMANASDDMRAAGYAKWLGMTPQERYEASALGKADAFSMEGPSPGEARLKDMAFGNSYWAGVAKNIAYGKELPEARLPRLRSGKSVDTSELEPAYRESGSLPPPTQQTQTLEGITRSAMGNPNVQNAARELERLKAADPEAAKFAEEEFFRYMERLYGISDEGSVSKIFNLLRGRP